MEDKSTNGTEKSRIVWDELEGCVRTHVQRFIQGLLEDEVTEPLGRSKHERRGRWMRRAAIVMAAASRGG